MMNTLKHIKYYKAKKSENLKKLFWLTIEEEALALCLDNWEKVNNQTIKDIEKLYSALEAKGKENFPKPSV